MSYITLENTPRANLELMSKGIFSLPPPPLPTQEPSPIKTISTREILEEETHRATAYDYNRTLSCIIIIIATLSLGALYGYYLHPGCYGIAGISLIPLFLIIYECQRARIAPTEEEDGIENKIESESESEKETSSPTIPKILKPMPKETLDDILYYTAEYLYNTREALIAAVEKKMSRIAFGPIENRLTPKEAEKEVLKESFPDYGELILFAKNAKDNLPEIETETSSVFIEVCSMVCGSDESKRKRVVCFHSWPTSYCPTIQEATYHPFSSVIRHKETQLVPSTFAQMTPYINTPTKPGLKVSTPTTGPTTFKSLYY